MNCAFDLVRRRYRDTSWNAAPLVTEHGEERFSATQMPGPQEALLDGEAVELRHQAMDQLTPMERTAFVLRHMEEKSIGEIAVALGATTSSVKQAVFRAVGKLRRALRQEPETIQPHVKEVR
jgi:RNA polymerase sigma-70 factor (ECF subfamily)